MAHYYHIVNESNGNRDLTYFSSTRKNEILKDFNRLMKSLDKDANYSVQMIREGYARYTFYGEYGMIDGEYYIIRD